FKIVSEYVICTILLAGLVHLRRRRAHFDGVVFHMLAVSIVLTIIAELMFTFYISVFGISNLVGHYFKLASFWLIYKAIIETGLQRPYALLFRDLAQSEKRYRDLVETMPTGICEIDPHGRFTYINPAGLEMGGYTEADIAGEFHLGMVLDAAEKDKAQRRIAALLKGDAVESTEYHLLRKDGARADIIVNATPVYRDGRFTAVQANLTDVTELHRLQKSLQQARKMESVAILAGGMAHEINNALMGVSGKIELFQLEGSKRVWSDADYADVLGGCDRIAELIKHLLAYSRGGRYRSEVIDMAAFIPEAISKIAIQLGPEIRLAYRFAPDLPKVTVDPIQLAMVVSAIVENAVEAIEDAGRIEIDLESKEIDGAQAKQMPGMQPGRYLRLRVRDTGRGMDQEALRNIFEPFYTSKFQGRGLGMAAVYGIIKNHNGWVGVDSKPGLGTTVEIYVPVEA
ncbi:MAG: PAS domain S-box protein, partial [Desulfatitalea sp.]|nr:PAS domain S-box protein [Desulfatitalea sp.]